jgi:hypothetical protein
MEIELRTERPQNFDIAEPVDVDPVTLVIEMRHQFFPVFNYALFEMARSDSIR